MSTDNNEKQNGTGGSDVGNVGDGTSTPATAPSPNSTQAHSSEEAAIAKMLAEKCLDHFHEAMKNEINRLWQRSIFLATFLVLIFVGYGNVLMRLFDSECGCGFDDGYVCVDFRLNLACVVIALLGVLFSSLWIMMAKGSKAWQEKYERTLYCFINGVKRKYPKIKELTKLGFAHGFLKGVENKGFNNWLCSVKAGAYSASKINVAIGIVSGVFWVIVGSVHSALLPPSFGRVILNFMSEFVQLRWFSPVVFVIVSVVLVLILRRWNKSSVIQKKQDKEEKRRKKNKARRDRYKAKLKENSFPEKKDSHEDK